MYQIVSESRVTFGPLLGVFSTVETEENTKIFGKAYTNFVRQLPYNTGYCTEFSVFRRIFLNLGAMKKQIRYLAGTPEIDTVQEDVRRIWPSVLDVFVELYFVSKCIKMYLIQFQRKTGRNGGQKWAISGKNDRLGGISPVDMWYLACGYVVSPCGKVVSRKIGKSLIRLRFRYLGCICGISRGGFFFQKANFTVFR